MITYLRPVLATLVYVTMVAVAIIGTSVLFEDDYISSNIAMLAIAIFIVTSLLKSIYKVPNEQIVAVFFIWDYVGSLASNTLIESRAPDRRKYPAENAAYFQEANLHRSWLGSFAFALWPFYQVVRLPATAEIVRYRVSSINLSNDAKGKVPGFPANVDATIVLQLGFNLRKFFGVYRGMIRHSNLTIDDDISYVVDRDTITGKPAKESYHGSLFVKLFSAGTSTTVRETMRAVIARHHFSNIVTALRDIEDKIKVSLAAPESSFVKSGLLMETDQGLLDMDKIRPEVLKKILGPSAYSIDVNIEDPIPANKNLQDDQSAEARAQNLANAKELEGEGEARRLEKIKDRTGLDPQTVLAMDALKNANSLNIVTAGDPIAQAVLNLVKGGKK